MLCDVQVDILQPLEFPIEKIQIADLDCCLGLLRLGLGHDGLFLRNEVMIGMYGSQRQLETFSRKNTRARMFSTNTVSVISSAPPQASRTQLS